MERTRCSVKLYALLMFVFWCCFGCTPGGDDPPPPTTTTTTTIAPPPPPPPPDGPKPSDYIKLARVPSILEWQSSANVGLIAGAQAQHWAGSLDVWNTLSKCPWAFEGSPPYFRLTKARADAFAVTGQSLTTEARQHFIPSFPHVNRRCDPGHAQHHPDFCEVTNVRKERYAPFGALGDPDTPRGEFWRHLDRANDMRDLAGRCLNRITAAGGTAYDSIAGWCIAMNGLGWTAEDCT